MMQLAVTADPGTRPVGTDLGTIAHPGRRIPPLPMVATGVVGPAGGWATRDEAVSGAALLTAREGVAMLAIMQAGDRYVARDVLVNVSRSGNNWKPWFLEGAVRQAGRPVIDWPSGPQELVALVHRSIRVIRP